MRGSCPGLSQKPLDVKDETGVIDSIMDEDCVEGFGFSIVPGEGGKQVA